MFRLNRACQKFLVEYASLYPSAREAAPIVRDEIDRAIAQSGYLIHSVTARAKTMQSLRGKLRRKAYASPQDELTDIVGARVITYYRDAVDPIAEKLRDRFRIDKSASVDKRQALGMRQFGYRSVHLIASVRPLAMRPNAFLREYRFEIQVRSILEHAWAEIEHEVVYKSGVEMRDETKRRFAALAGGLELFDGEFLSLRQQRDELIQEYARGYEQNRNRTLGFDVARLLGFLEATLPSGRSWRSADREGAPIAAGLDVSCVEALHAAGLATPESLGAILKTQKFRRYTRAFSAASGIDPAQISHLAAVILALAAKKPAVLKRHFPEMLFDANVRSIVEN